MLFYPRIVKVTTIISLFTTANSKVTVLGTNYYTKNIMCNNIRMGQKTKKLFTNFQLSYEMVIYIRTSETYFIHFLTCSSGQLFKKNGLSSYSDCPVVGSHPVQRKRPKRDQILTI